MIINNNANQRKGKMKNRCYSIFSLLTVLVISTSCGSATPQPGSWEVPWDREPGGENHVKTVDLFFVSDDSITIDGLSISPLFWSCGDVEIDGNHIFFVSDEDNTYKAIVPTLVKGILSPINDGSFRIELPVFVFEDSIFNTQSGMFTFTGTFTSSSKASGTWELDLPASGENCVGTWHAIPFLPDDQ
jgi:hypothetical protein